MIPWREIEVLFLDAGNTLVSVDFEWMARELGARGLACEAQALCRAEAAARPALSERLARGHSTEGASPFHAYLRGVLERLPDAPDAARLDPVVESLVPVLRIPGEADRLWRVVMPGVPEALERFRALGLRLVVVSNADGSVERGLRTAGLRDFFDAVIDSQVVGFEKPDPRIFGCALEAVGADPSRTLHVGDLYHADVVGARAAGLHAALLDPWQDWPPSDCECVADLGALAERLHRERAEGPA